MKHIRGLHICYYSNFVGAVALLVLAILMLSEHKQPTLLIIDIAIIALSFIGIIYFGIRCIVNAVLLSRNNDLLSLRRFMRASKVGLIPFFVLNFVYYCLFIFVLFAASRGIFLFGPIPLILIPLVLFTYLATFITSSFSIAFIVLLRRKGIIERKQMTFHIILQLLFFLDILGLIYLLLKFKKNNPLLITDSCNV